MQNIPEVKLGIVAVSRDCFPITLSEKRRKAVVAAFKAKGLSLIHIFVAQIGGAQVLDGVHLRRAHHRLAVGRGHAQVEGGDGRAAHRVHAGNVEAGQKAQVVDLEAVSYTHLDVYKRQLLRDRADEAAAVVRLSECRQGRQTVMALRKRRERSPLGDAVPGAFRRSQRYAVQFRVGGGRRAARIRHVLAADGGDLFEHGFEGGAQLLDGRLALKGPGNSAEAVGLDEDAAFGCAAGHFAHGGIVEHARADGRCV